MLTLVCLFYQTNPIDNLQILAKPSKPSTQHFMWYGELARYPLNMKVKLQIVSFWSKLIDGKQSKLLSLIYRLLVDNNADFV
jgi:hypothetical protein